ncbi:valine--tRNA ligase [Abditibacterium utsteinense]|nr:valine--tRNA ligase [Abditibacterium utsteinense]
MSENLIQTEMAPQFDPSPVEHKWSAFWLEHNLGTPRPPKDGEKPFVITIPPPNVTGVLHLGHALQHSIHDALLRFHRMKGEAVLCVPGTDHAGIATQIKVEAQLRELEGISRHDLGREAFIERVYAWKNQYGATIIEQMKALGCSYDWSRERFTMDEGYVRAVLTVFKDWFERGLIYRGFRLVNWSSGAQTTVSDLEIEYKDVQGTLTFIRYPVESTKNESDSTKNEIEYVTVATSRPETMLGDTAVAVHPDDPRYAHLRGRNVILPLQNRAIPIVFDPSVSMEFGTGALKVTPAHSADDYEMGQRHGLEMISVIGFDDNITEAGGAYAGMNKVAARKKIVADLTELGLIEKIEPLHHSVGHCARTGVVIEPLLSEQWFVAMKTLARPVADAIRMNRVEYIPNRFGQTSLEWLDNIRDWCISRQLWWGHRIPIWYGTNGEVKCSLEPIEGWTQDEDVLDTWFSSALWPFAVLGWPDNLETQFYPTSVLITGRDILNLWVSRMIATSLDCVENEIPFHQVLVHPTIQDSYGQRMSKSLGTGIDPLELIEIYGADATRYGLLQFAGGAQDVRFLDSAMTKLGEGATRKFIRENRGKALPLEWTENDGKPTERFPQMQAARNFANKIWNAARFVLISNPAQWNGQVPPDLSCRWMESRLSATIYEVTRALDGYEFDAAGTALYGFVWGDFCDWFLEISKPKLRDGDQNHIAFMAHILEQSMRLLHPFMPFLSEEIWAKLTKNEEESALCFASWPVAGETDIQAETDFALLQETTRAIRNLRAQAEIAPSKKVNVVLVSDGEVSTILRVNSTMLSGLANLESIQFLNPSSVRPENAISQTLAQIEVILPLEGLIDIEKERAKLTRQRELAQKDFDKMSAKLQNPAFVERAPAAVLEKDRARVLELEAQIQKLSERLASL